MAPKKENLNWLGNFIRGGDALLNRIGKNPFYELIYRPARAGINELTYMADQIAAGQTPYADVQGEIKRREELGIPVENKTETSDGRVDRAPAKAEEPDAATLALGSQLQLPKTGTNQDLVKMYSAQRSAGKYNMPEIEKMYMEQGRPDLAKWAAANPDLAQREYMKSIQKMGARPEGEELIEAYGGGEPKEGEEIIDAVNFLKKKAGLQK